MTDADDIKRQVQGLRAALRGQQPGGGAGIGSPRPPNVPPSPPSNAQPPLPPGTPAAGRKAGRKSDCVRRVEEMKAQREDRRRRAEEAKQQRMVEAKEAEGRGGIEVRPDPALCCSARPRPPWQGARRTLSQVLSHSQSYTSQVNLSLKHSQSQSTLCSPRIATSAIFAVPNPFATPYPPRCAGGRLPPEDSRIQGGQWVGGAGAVGRGRRRRRVGEPRQLFHPRVRSEAADAAHRDRPSRLRRHLD